MLTLGWDLVPPLGARKWVEGIRDPVGQPAIVGGESKGGTQGKKLKLGCLS